MIKYVESGLDHIAQKGKTNLALITRHGSVVYLTEKELLPEDIANIQNYAEWTARNAYEPKNVSAIDKIIAELAYKDYQRANPRGKYKRYHPYTLSPETNEAREIKRAYLHDEITEEEYKTWCLRYNLRKE